MIFLVAKNSTHRLFLFSQFAFFSFSYKTSGNIHFCAIASVFIGSINSISSQLTEFAKMFLMERNPLFEAAAFIKGFIAQMLNKTDSIHLDLVYLGSELYRFYFLTSHNGSDIRFKNRYDTTTYTLRIAI